MKANGRVGGTAPFIPNLGDRCELSAVVHPGKCPDNTSQFLQFDVF
jgi:hypothetical protein